MKYGFLSDAHGNVTALRKCLEYFAGAGVNSIFFLGDAVGYLPDAAGVVALLKSVNACCLMGNHEAMLLGRLEREESKEAVYRLRETAEGIPEAVVSHFNNLTPEYELAMEGLEVLLLHGSPQAPLTGYVYPDSDLSEFESLPYDVVMMGHTHYPFIRQTGALKVINVGSCGLPRDQGNLASVAVYSSLSGEWEIIRIPFDVGEVMKGREKKIHPSVAECLKREARGPVAGRIVAV